MLFIVKHDKIEPVNTVDYLLSYEKVDDPMKKLYVLTLSVFMLFSLVSCDRGYEKLDYYFGDYQVFLLDHGACEMYVQTKIYEDDVYSYYLGASGCTASEYYFIKVNREYIGVGKAIKQEIISIDDVIDSNVPFLIIKEDNDE